MSSDDIPQVLRLRKKHAPGAHQRPTAEDGKRIVDAQSVRYAFIAALIVVLVFSLLWMLVSDLFERVLPWLSMVLGIPVGIAVRRAGQGLDWRFPAIAGVMVLLGALLGNVVISAATSAREFDTNIFVILASVTTYTWPVFFDEVMNAADFVYALFGAAIAAAYSNRRLTRREFQAVRIYREGE
ncbi:MAG: hypothetical protein AAFX10_02655 [Pseudomonadota bacterium]